jgi:hypothetical protein
LNSIVINILNFKQHGQLSAYPLLNIAKSIKKHNIQPKYFAKTIFLSPKLSQLWQFPHTQS